MAKNFKCLKVTVVGADGNPQLSEQHAGDQLVADVMDEVADATPPVYNEQGKPRGRPKSKASKTSKTKKHGKRKGGKKTKRLSRRASRKKSELAGARESTCEEPKKSKGGKRDDQLDESPTAGSSRDKVKKRGKGNMKKSPVRITPSDSSTQKRRQTRSKPVVEIEDDQTEVVNVESQESKPPKKTRRTRKTVSKHQPDHPLPRHSEAECPEVEVTSAQVPVAQVEIPADSIPAPDHVTAHMVYSSAYRRSLKLFPDDNEKAQEAGKQASQLMRIHRMCSPALSGNFRPPRSNKPADLGGNDESP